MKKPFAIAAISFISFLVLASVANAEVTAAGAQQGLGTFAGLITTFNNTVVKALATLFMSGAVVAFFFGLVKYIWGIRGGEVKAINDGKQFIIWALVALFVMFSVYGIIKFFQGIVPGLDSTTITIPDINYGGGAGSPSPNTNTNNNPLSPSPNTNTAPAGTPGAGNPCNSAYGCTAPNTNTAPAGTPGAGNPCDPTYGCPTTSEGIR